MGGKSEFRPLAEQVIVLALFVPWGMVVAMAVHRVLGFTDVHHTTAARRAVFRLGLVVPVKPAVLNLGLNSFVPCFCIRI